MALEDKGRGQWHLGEGLEASLDRTAPCHL